MEVLPTVNFRRYMAFDKMAIWQFYSLLRGSIIGAKSVALLKILVNEQVRHHQHGEYASCRLEAVGHR
jgi:hypothetical protein